MKTCISKFDHLSNLLPEVYTVLMPEVYIVLMPIPKIDKQCPKRNRNIYNSEIWILLTTYSQKLGYTLIKTCYSRIYLGLQCFLDL